LDAACRRAVAIGSTSYRSVESILKHNLDQKPLPDQPAAEAPIEHTNIRGAAYYH
jgi:S-adenosylmethionine:tRNA-ribosyltransferase-isomerase (queuine synthetase)